MILPQWPWVSRKSWDILAGAHQDLKESSVGRGTYEAVCDERDRLLAQNAELLNHVQRMDRVEHGVSEVERAPKPDPGRFPQELRDHIAGFATAQIRTTMIRTAIHRRQQGESWADIVNSTMSEDARNGEIPGP